nr:zinc finger BED domain-containing protein RICESLEEPER 2-like [Ipomoea batatas]
MLSEFYKIISPKRSILCAGVDGKRMQMAWRDSRNKIDCGVFLMRHMETYLGQRISNWDCGLIKGDTLKLHKLRMRYMKELSIFEFSIHKSRNLSRAYQSGVCASPTSCVHFVFQVVVDVVCMTMVFTLRQLSSISLSVFVWVILGWAKCLGVCAVTSYCVHHVFPVVVVVCSGAVISVELYFVCKSSV